MDLATLSIRRPVLVIVASLFIILFGSIAVNRLGVREYPSVDPPVITVATTYVGASADVIESQITEPLEESVNGVAGIRSLTSVSREGRSTVTVEFDLDADIEAAANDVRDRVARASRTLPTDVEPPVVSKADADAFPIIFLTVRSPGKSLLELSHIASTAIKERMQTIPGVSEVRIWGEKRYAMRLWLDPEKLAAYGLTPLDVQSALSKENVELPAGRVEGLLTELSVRTEGRLSSAEDFENLILRDDPGSLVRFRDVGHAELGPENERTVLKRDGVPMVGVVIIPQPGSNHVAIAKEFYQRLEQVKRDLPPEFSLDLGFDSTKYIKQSIYEVVETIGISFLLVILIIFLFLREWRSTLIPVITIPISLVGTFFVMYLLGYTINVLTLLGLVLAIGLVVDDAIVILENIYSKIESGMEPHAAGVAGQREVFFAIISTTLALVAVFLPIVFLQGLVGRLFREFGVVVAAAVVISSFLALTLAPMMATRLLRKRVHRHDFYARTEPFFEKMRERYGRSLEFSFRHRWISLGLMLLSVLVIGFTFFALPSELSPMEDRSALRVYASAPEGSSYEYMDAYMDQLIEYTKDSIPEVKSIISVTSPGFGASSSVNSGFMRITLVDPKNRKLSQAATAGKMMKGLSRFSEAKAFVSQEQSIGDRRGGLPIAFVIKAPNFEELREKLPTFLEKASSDPAFRVVDVNLKFNRPEIRLSVDRDKARILGVSLIDIAKTLQSALAGQRYGYFIMDGKQYQIIGQVPRSERDEPLDLKKLYVRSKNGDLVQLLNLVSLKEETSPPQLYRYNRYVSATVSADMAPGVILADGIAAMQKIADENLPSSFSSELAGASRDFQESSSSLIFAFILALVLIYLVLAAQFESFRAPLAVMFTVPLALAGALATLWYFHLSLNIFSEIGMIMLIGLVTKNGILIVEFANQRIESGLSVIDGIKDAAKSRFRPILMTSLSTILGTMPIALALGAGSESRKPLGMAVIGGLILSTVLTLYVIPVLYSYIAKRPKHV